MGCPSPPLDAELFLREVLQHYENKPPFLYMKDGILTPSRVGV